MKATNLLRQQHSELMLMFHELNNSSSVENQRERFCRLKDMLQQHGSLEENFFYPRLFQLPDCANPVFDCFKQHEHMEELLSGITLDQPEFLNNIYELQQKVATHFEEEEELLTLADKLLSRAILKKMADEMLQETVGFFSVA